MKKPYAEPGLGEVFYTQNPKTAEPEMAMVNGWPVYVANTNTTEEHSNKIDLSEFPLVAGSRADGVFLEVWRGLVDDQMAGVTTPTDTSIVGTLRSVWVVDENKAWAVGENGILLKTTNGGVTWLTQPAPTSYTIRDIQFLTQKTGLLVGDGGSLYKTDNEGVSWAKIGLPVADDLHSIAIVDQGLVVVVGSRGTVLRSQDMFNFELITGTEQAADDLLSVHFYDRSIGWACGKNGLYLRTLDGGKSWKRYAINIPDEANPTKEKKVSTKLNGVRFVNLSDGWVVGDGGLILRTTDGGSRWANVSETIYDEEAGVYTKTTQNLNDIEVIKSYPLRISLSLYDTNNFSSASYTINPTSLDLYYRKVGTGEMDIRVRLNLAEYEKDVDLVNAINALEDGGSRIFQASLAYSDTAYLSHDESESISAGESAEIRFSMGDVVWIVGDGGTVLTSQNGGARWARADAKVSFNVLGVAFRGSSIGWIVGAQGEISKYDSALLPDPWVAQDTNLVKVIQRKVYAHGNLSSPSSLNLINNAVHPDIKVETSARTQIQYRIRVVEGIDPTANRDAGLGASYVFSRGPNTSVLGAGSYSFQNMGSVNGDYGLWRAPCRNTVDGYSYAIPMFIVSRRNQQPYNPNTNINGSSVEAVNAIRPDGLVYEDIILDDLLDIRKNISNFVATEVLGRTVDDLFKGKLRTSLGKSSAKGGQVGSLLTYSEELEDSVMDTIFDGSYNTEAVLADPVYIGGSQEGIAAPEEGEEPLVSLTFEVLVEGMYHNDISYFSATYASEDPLVDGTEIPGVFSGLGTSQVTFSFGEEVAQGSGVYYVIKGAYIDYSKKALVNNPTQPLQVKNFVLGSPNSSVNYLAVDTGVTSQIVRRLSSGVQGLTDYVEVSAETFGDTQEHCASKVRVHLYQEIASNSTEVIIPRNIEGYFVLAVREIRNVKDGGIYRMLKIDGTEESELKVFLASTYTVVEGSVIEIIAEVTTDTGLSGVDVGNTTQNNGESIEAVRNGNVAVFDSGVKSVEALYKSMLTTVDLVDGEYLIPGTLSVVGISSMPRLEGRVPYAWKITDGDTPGETVAVSITVDSNGYITALTPTESDADAELLVCLLVEENSKVDGGSTGVRISYKTPAPQTINPLPSWLSVEVVEGPKNMFISSVGNGGGFRNTFYKSPLADIPNPDNSIVNQAYFYNLFGLDFNSFSEEEGFVSLPLRVTRHPGQEIQLANPGLDNFGRSFYRTSSEALVFKAEEMLIGNPRKLMVPFLVRVSSISTNPVLTGEVLLAMATTVKNERLENDLRIGTAPEGSVISLYKVPGMPLIK